MPGRPTNRLEQGKGLLPVLYLRRAKISAENSETRKRYDTCGGGSAERIHSCTRLTPTPTSPGGGAGGWSTLIFFLAT